MAGGAILLLEVILLGYTIWGFAEARTGTGTFADLGAVALNLFFGVPLGAAGIIMAVPVWQEGKHNFAFVMIAVSTATAFQVWVHLARALVNLPA